MRFDMICEANGIEHRLTKPNHPWTNGQIERMNRTIKDATVKRFHHDSHDQLRTHLSDFMAAYNFARRLKTQHRRRGWLAVPEPQHDGKLNAVGEIGRTDRGRTRHRLGRRGW